jgi:hypothetical protein
MKKPLDANPSTLDPKSKRVAGQHDRPGFRRRPRAEPAWWTVRATAGEVTPGFSKAEILKPKPEDPRAPGGILERVADLLEDLRE